MRYGLWDALLTIGFVCFLSFMAFCIISTINNWTPSGDSRELAFKWMGISLIIGIVLSLLGYISSVFEGRRIKDSDVTVERAVKTYGYSGVILHGKGGHTDVNFIVTNGGDPDNKIIRLYCEKGFTKKPDGTEFWIFRNPSDNKFLKIIPADEYLGLITRDFRDVTSDDFYKFQ